MRKKLRSLRIGSGLTLGELARITGIGKSTLGNYETGRTFMSQDKIKILADSLKTTPEEIDADEEVLSPHSTPFPAEGALAREETPPDDYKPAHACTRCRELEEEVRWLRETMGKLQDSFREALAAVKER